MCDSYETIIKNYQMDKVYVEVDHIYKKLQCILDKKYSVLIDDSDRQKANGNDLDIILRILNLINVHIDMIYEIPTDFEVDLHKQVKSNAESTSPQVEQPAEKPFEDTLQELHDELTQVMVSQVAELNAESTELAEPELELNELFSEVILEGSSELWDRRRQLKEEQSNPTNEIIHPEVNEVDQIAPSTTNNTTLSSDVEGIPINPLYCLKPKERNMVLKSCFDRARENVLNLFIDSAGNKITQDSVDFNELCEKEADRLLDAWIELQHKT